MKLLKFYADWCGPCKTIGKLLSDYDRVTIQSVDVDDDDNTDLLTKYSIRSVPTLILLDDKDTVLHRFAGVVSVEELNNVIDTYDKE